MFGALLGTLQKFRQEETRMRDKVSCYSIIDYFSYFIWLIILYFPSLSLMISWDGGRFP
jgi:hypothetical protein